MDKNKIERNLEKFPDYDDSITIESFEISDIASLLKSAPILEGRPLPENFKSGDEK
jgi:hypothetical protein